MSRFTGKTFTEQGLMAGVERLCDQERTVSVVMVVLTRRCFTLSDVDDAALILADDDMTLSAAAASDRAAASARDCCLLEDPYCSISPSILASSLFKSRSRLRRRLSDSSMALSKFSSDSAAARFALAFSIR